ncbi:MAG: energy-coupled thiamine transporter ThiT [Clostridium sp.]|jgi:thiamine transporter|uniref:energy-coupled thiamine transporter ThiT n=1 Tax=Clostridium sp. TaxID=1506 RepID=UPI0025C5F30E|nr:energy-coupled thiamine transporter ThiT [Clostridium sp.]MCH3965348.1 energy-coupled thiamine transporter ThiT [Clostridium sp.]MCI1714569.1 energy-coupled thiamine transporter ThiT [Clostridium sp.]MCI1798831.1 energy-coupled thiamine transporter ThiT [Clostridium sp.]MCI1812438.1 energy-coupled thiamine transporter ThiT [Clostridium sp.]MCI1869641.1 energy-coupled thiamine transporter ThiT [Clostridium sp.]
MSLLKNLTEISSHPSSIFALIALIAFILFIARIKKIHFTTQLITQIGIALALATILKVFRIYHFPQGGSITLGSMVPILLMAFLYGPEVGFLTGFLYGIITLILDPYILQPVQVLFDYPLPFMALGITGYFRSHKLLGTASAIFMRFICHFISGILFFGSFAPKGMSPVIYSLSLNGSFMLIEGIICIVIMAALPLQHLESILKKDTLNNSIK